MASKTLRDIVGGGNILDSEKTLEEYAGDMSFSPRLKPRYVVKPRQANQIQELVKWANENATPLIPVSSGAPHFRGDTVPGTEGVVIIDLSGLNEVTRIDATNRIAMIEPGVTFSELIPQLEKAGLRLNMPLLPRANKSVVGSMLGREPVMMPLYQWDSQDPLTCVEIVFGSGDIFRTGSAAGPGTLEDQWNARQAQVNPMGPGQTSFGNVIQGAQGTLGIVNWATVRCEILPRLQKPFLVGSDKYEPLADFVYRMLWWKAVDECLIFNNSDLAAILAKNPKEYKILKKSLPPWILFFCLAGFAYYQEEKIAYQEKALQEEAKKAGLALGNSISDISADNLLELLKKPAAEPYWKLRLKGACQDIFFLTTLDKVPPFIKIMQEKAGQCGYHTANIGIYIQPLVQGTSCHCEFSMFYDPQNYKEVNDIKELYTQAGQALINAGAFFSRPYGVLVDEIYRRDAETTAALKKVKKIFDPNNIMNPGKLCF
jgi:FAD/FMN-containing dehydrogenase